MATTASCPYGTTVVHAVCQGLHGSVEELTAVFGFRGLWIGWWEDVVDLFWLLLISWLAKM